MNRLGINICLKTLLPKLFESFDNEAFYKETEQLLYIILAVYLLSFMTIGKAGILLQWEGGAALR